jgi:4-hydroxybenzoate polyprenyltransferase
MTSLQFAIGALNDIVDAPADASRVPPKPIPAGIITPPAAVAVAVSAALVGVVLAIGAVYDLVAKGTPWSWVPFAIGIPILPVYGWYGATGALPPFAAVLVVIATLAGAGLAIANARADLDPDTETATASVATALGSERSWWVDAGLLLAAITVGIVSLGSSGFSIVPWTMLSIGIGTVVAGLLLGRRPERRARVRSWELQAVGAALAAAGWIGAMGPPVT